MTVPGRPTAGDRDFSLSITRGFAKTIAMLSRPTFRLIHFSAVFLLAVACGPAPVTKAPTGTSGTGGATGSSDQTGTDGFNPDTTNPTDGTDWTGPTDGTDTPTDQTDGSETGPVCTPSVTTCKDPTTALTCNETGTEWTPTVCEGLSKCWDGQCADVICTPGDDLGQCAGPNSYLVCNGVGTHWVPQLCDLGLTCYEGDCVDYACQPNSFTCLGFGAVQQCKSDGSGWEVKQQCEKGGSCFSGTCISACDVDLKAATYRGCEYFAVDLDNIEGGQFEPVAIVVSVPSAVESADVEITNMATGNKLSASELNALSLTVASGTLGVFELPPGQDIDGSSKSLTSYHITTSSPATVHQFNPLNGEEVYTNDASLLLPSAAGGTEYYIMSWPQRSDAFETLRGFFTIIATEPGQTQVLVTPRSDVLAGEPGSGVSFMSEGDTVGFVLQQGEVLNLETDGEQGADLTGSHVVANQRVTVFAGHECANVPLGINACDHLEQQMVPVEAWGKRYIADSFKKRSKDQFDVYRVMAGGTDVLVETSPPQKGYEKFLLQAGAYVSFPSAESFMVKASGRITVGHFMTGSSYPGHVKSCGNTGIGDPAFTLSVPTQQFLKEYTVLTPPGYAENYVNIIAPPNAGVLVDGQPLTSPLKQVGSLDWGAAQHPLATGVHTITAKKKFGLTAYGYDCDVSYAYPGGLRLLELKEEKTP